METVVLACNTIRDEIEKAALDTHCPYRFAWVESGLHLVPGSLRLRLQEELDRMNGAQRVLLAFGICGGAVTGLKTGNFQLVIPRVDDCITLLLGSAEIKRRCAGRGGVYFLTRGWLEGEANIWKEYHATLARFGPERTERIYRKMLAHYKFLGLIDTGAYELSDLLPRAREICAALQLELLTLEGQDQYLRRLLQGPWDEDYFATIPPFTTVELTDLCLDSSAPVRQIQAGV
ncbi:MAG: DUF1638 domain-containing protein [Syntrophobacteraceae bacterium]|nr:DUF1638 domain-containing protein [Syntrophobacteraceae bacterium]